MIFLCDRDPFIHIKEHMVKGFKVHTSYYKDGIMVGSLNRIYGRGIKKEVSGKFVLFKHKNTDFYMLVTDGSYAYFKDGILRYIQKKYPKFVLPFFYSWEIEMMLNSLSHKVSKCDIRLTKLSRKSRIPSLRKKKESDLTWTDLPYKEVFKQTRQQDAWIEKIYFDLLTERIGKIGIFFSIKMKGSISRHGIFQCNNDFLLFYDSVIVKGMNIFAERKNKLSNRARTKANQFRSKPIFIEFEEPIFKNKEQNFRLINSIRLLTHSGNSIIHTNPYLHMTVTDYIDNSTFEIWVLSDKRISIVPQTVCTMASLSKLLDHISREFKEGIEKDYGEIDFE